MSLMRLTAALGLLAIASVQACGRVDTPPDGRVVPTPLAELRAVPAGQPPPPGQGPVLSMADSEVRVILVMPGQAAEREGFRAGDVLLAADEKEIGSEEALAAALKAAPGRKVFFEVQRGRGNPLELLSLQTPEPGWLVLSGHTFKSFLLRRAQDRRPVKILAAGESAPPLGLPTLAGPAFDLEDLRGRPVALLFWGTFSKPSETHLGALHRACARPVARRIACVAIDTLELFTAVLRTADYQAELLRVRQALWPSLPLPIDLFQDSERKFGILKVPTLILLGPDGAVAERLDGPRPDPAREIPAALDRLLENAR